jgi:hypothetical protein
VRCIAAISRAVSGAPLSDARLLDLLAVGLSVVDRVGW